MPTLLFEIGSEELPASAVAAGARQLPELVKAQLGVVPARVFAGPRRLAVRVEDLAERTPDEWAKGPPLALREKAAAGFAKRHGVSADALEERDGFLGVTVPGKPLADVLPERLDAILRGLAFPTTMRSRASVRRRSGTASRPARSRSETPATTSACCARRTSSPTRPSASARSLRGSTVSANG